MTTTDPVGETTAAAGTVAGPTVRVLVSPFADGPTVNPYLELLSGALGRNGVSVGDFGRRNVLARGVDIVHVHWPERMIRWQRPLARVIVDVVVLLGVLAVVRCRGVRLVWTAHNVAPHSLARPRAYAVFFTLFVRMVDVVVVLTESSEAHVRAAHPALRRRPFAVVPHGHYRDRYPPAMARDEARLRTGLAPVGVTFLCFGLVRRYKNIDGLLRAFLADPPPVPTSETLLVAGGAHDEDLVADLVDLAAASPDIHLMLERIPDEDVSLLHGAADVVVLPYAAPSVLNSGAALLGLSLDRPVVAPDTPAMRDLQGVVGSSWLRVFTGGPEQALLGARELARAERVGRPPLEALDWDVIAVRCAQVYARARDRSLPVADSGPR